MRLANGEISETLYIKLTDKWSPQISNQSEADSSTEQI